MSHEHLWPLDPREKHIFNLWHNIHVISHKIDCTTLPRENHAIKLWHDITLLKNRPHHLIRSRNKEHIGQRGLGIFHMNFMS